MLPRSDTQFRLSVWRPASLSRSYLYGRNDGANDRVFSPLDESQVLEQIYAWDTGPNDVLGAATPAVTDRIRKDLVEAFAPDHLPRDRSVSKFLTQVTSILQDPQLPSGTHWSDCEESIRTDTDEELNLRANMTLAVLRHFRWVGCVFVDVPSASVLIR